MEWIDQPAFLRLRLPRTFIFCEWWRPRETIFSSVFISRNVCFLFDVEVGGSAHDSDGQMRDLFKYIQMYKPEQIELDTELKCFLPDYIPSVGDIDPMIKVIIFTLLSKRSLNRKHWRTNMTSNWVWVCWTSPRRFNLILRVFLFHLVYIDAFVVIDLQLRSSVKSSHQSSHVHQIRSIENLETVGGQKALFKWCQAVQELHQHKPSSTVVFSRRMPDVEMLMDAWPEASGVESFLNGTSCA